MVQKTFPSPKIQPVNTPININSMKILKILVLSVLLVSAVGYPIRCVQIGGDSGLGTVAECDVKNDPFPFQWTASVRLKKNIKWAGPEDIRYFYSNPDETVEGNCTLATPLAGSYSKNDNLTIEQTCFGFNPPLVKGASLLVLYFYTHHDSFDDVLMFNYPIPGYVISPRQPHLVEGLLKMVLLKRIARGEKV